ncbi:MAG: (Fe-S)-binding protein, partial [Candidatus Odinarchaeota archaeon]
SSVCPVAKYDNEFLPRRIVYECITNNPERAVEAGLASCLTCKLCEQTCPMNVTITSLMHQLRINLNEFPDYAHANILKPLNNIMMNLASVPKKVHYVSKRVKVDENSDWLYFTGCAPYFDIMFRDDFDYRGVNVLNDTVNLLNQIDIIPAIVDGEKCCGHDQYWRGEIKDFKALAEQNIDLLGRFDTIVVNCPECMRTLTTEYHEHFGTDFKVKHISQVLHNNLKKLNVKIPSTGRKISATFHDSCRLGRYMGIYDEPRNVLEQLNVDLREMSQNREKSLCCGVSSFSSCNQAGKEIRKQKIAAASKTGADYLVVPCPKCQIHLKCLQNDKSEEKKQRIKIVDFSTLLTGLL